MRIPSCSRSAHRTVKGAKDVQFNKACEAYTLTRTGVTRRCCALCGAGSGITAGRLYRFTYTFFEHFTWLFLHEALNNWRRETLQLAPLGFHGLHAITHDGVIRLVAGQ